MTSEDQHSLLMYFMLKMGGPHQMGHMGHKGHMSIGVWGDQLIGGPVEWGSKSSELCGSKCKSLATNKQATWMKVVLSCGQEHWWVSTPVKAAALGPSLTHRPALTIHCPLLPTHE